MIFKFDGKVIDTSFVSGINSTEHEYQGKSTYIIYVSNKGSGMNIMFSFTDKQKSIDFVDEIYNNMVNEKEIPTYLERKINV
ncbi:MAG: hypothetical protein PF437_03370 [Sulfurimonas sp.]|jgi:hypothetical protein|nr:hypothetical protein [Sulfurimonas sp.]